MLFINNKVCNESIDSEKFELKCVRYLRKNYPGHSFEVKGLSSTNSADILVDDKFYIECKMAENGEHRQGAQITGFSLIKNGSLFDCHEYVKDYDAVNKIMKHINKNAKVFSNFNTQNSGAADIELDKSIFASWVNEFYANKGVKFFMSIFNGEFIIFKNTVGNLLKYFDLSAAVRYYSNGTKDIPKRIRDDAIAYLSKQLNILSVDFEDRQTILKIKDNVDGMYIDSPYAQLYLSNYKQPSPDHYRLMKVSGIGSSRVLFHLYTTRPQDPKDLKSFKDYLNK